ncbi:hypothetical protein ACGFMM_31225 [Streptomyces sp. NPDC048604]|uniref:hypothetical protein n=1 Tax=Streptomyces sp. NPDC048604 TaxID=3365578 RepID=UPI00371A16E3
MSNDIAYPVFHSPDPVLALSMARRLMEFGRCEYTNVSLYAELRSVDEVRRGAKELPAGWFRGQEQYGEFDDRVPFEDRPAWLVGVRGAGLPTDPTAYEGRLPVDYELLNQAVDGIEDAFTAAIGPSVGEINWQDLCWPDAPEVGFHGESKHAEVTLLLNASTRAYDEPADDHTVLVHVRSVDVDGCQVREPYAHWLAGQVGLTVIGPGQRC